MNEMKNAALAVFLLLFGVLILSACDQVREARHYTGELAVDAQHELDQHVPREFRCAVYTAGVTNLDEDASLLRVLALTGAQRAACEGLEEADVCDVYSHTLEHAGEDIPVRYMDLVREAYTLRCGQ